MNLNVVLIAGHLTRDPELKPVGTTEVCNFAIAINDKYRDREGQLVERVTYVDCVCWGTTAKNVAGHMRKGSGVLIEGRLKSDTWTTQAGEVRRKLMMDAQRVTFTDPKGGHTVDPIAPARPADARPQPGPGGVDDDAPFAAVDARMFPA